ncbi:MAG TPA: hypothetical protein EYG31_07145 [Porticoccaceae bacterium]|jgi:quinol monooxygenase YgiN|nr:hypothetical protein [Gammaproteobacteria bacterium]HIL60398.1 hypothetical protein [Porticoccaceae bacterium]
MILVLESVTVPARKLQPAISLNCEHMTHSRLEPDCILHDFHSNAETENHLAFFEPWGSINAPEKYFQVPESGEFVIKIGKLASVAPKMNLYESKEIRRH